MKKKMMERKGEGRRRIKSRRTLVTKGRGQIRTEGKANVGMKEEKENK